MMETKTKETKSRSGSTNTAITENPNTKLLEAEFTASRNYRVFKVFVLSITLVNLLVFIAYIVTSLLLIDLTVCDDKLFPDNDYKVRDAKNGQLVLHNLLTHEGFIYDVSGNGRVMLTRRLGANLDNDNYRLISVDRNPNGGGGSDLSNNYRVDFTSKSSAIYNLTFQANDNKESSVGGVQCKTYTWQINAQNSSDRLYRQEFEDCVSLGEAKWFGQAESKFQQFWPINPYTTLNDGYIPYVNGLFEDGASVMERYWLSTNGLAIVVDRSVPLHLKKNTTDICFKSNKYEAPYSWIAAAPILLKYDICQIDTNFNRSTYLNRLHLHVLNNYFGRPSGLPDEQMFKYPIWSTWAKYKKNISEPVVLKFADEIHKFAQERVAHIEIDDFWETAYGNLDFDRAKFPDFKRLTTSLRDEYGYATTLWMHPFANVEADSIASFTYLAANNLTVRTIDGLRPGLTSWWDSPGSAAVILDVTNSNATDYFYNKLKAIQDNEGVSSFKFDAGEIFWLPKAFWLANQTLQSPVDYTEAYARISARFGEKIEIRVGAHTQDLPVFVRMLDKDSNWMIGTNGLESLVTTALTMSILGYPFILPDMIGGNAYTYNGSVIDFDAKNITLPDYELYIRWAQLSAFLPAMQFSISPWQYNETMEAVCSELISIHADLVHPLLIKYGQESVRTGAPIIRPVWWADNGNLDAYEVADEFLIGDEILVAPVVKQGAEARDVFFPKGKWTNEDRSKEYNGPSTIMNYPAPIDTIPYFFRI